MISLLIHTRAHTSRAAQTKEIGHTCVKVCVGSDISQAAHLGGVSVMKCAGLLRLQAAAAAYRLHDRITGAAAISQRVTGAAQSRRDAETRRAHANGSL